VKSVLWIWDRVGADGEVAVAVGVAVGVRAGVDVAVGGAVAV